MSTDFSDYGTRLGARLRAVRKLAGMSQDDVAAASGGQFTGEALSYWERGERELAMETLSDLAGILGVPVVVLMPDRPEGDAALARLAAESAERKIREILAPVARLDGPVMSALAAIARGTRNFAAPQAADPHPSGGAGAPPPAQALMTG